MTAALLLPLLALAAITILSIVNKDFSGYISVIGDYVLAACAITSVFLVRRQIDLSKHQILFIKIGKLTNTYFTDKQHNQFQLSVEVINYSNTFTYNVQLELEVRSKLRLKHYSKNRIIVDVLYPKEEKQFEKSKIEKMITFDIGKRIKFNAGENFIVKVKLSYDLETGGRITKRVTSYQKFISRGDAIGISSEKNRLKYSLTT
jgi:hypothetical protein